MKQFASTMKPLFCAWKNLEIIFDTEKFGKNCKRKIQQNYAWKSLKTILSTEKSKKLFYTQISPEYHFVQKKV